MFAGHVRHTLLLNENVSTITPENLTYVHLDKSLSTDLVSALSHRLRSRHGPLVDSLIHN